MLWQVTFQRSVYKTLDRLPAKIRERIICAAIALEHDPFPPDMKKLRVVPPACRIRVGDYRIVYEVSLARHTVLVFRVGHRREGYRGL